MDVFSYQDAMMDRFFSKEDKKKETRMKIAIGVGIGVIVAGILAAVIASAVRSSKERKALEAEQKKAASVNAFARISTK